MLLVRSLRSRLRLPSDGVGAVVSAFSTSVAAVEAEWTINKGPRNDWSKDEIKAIYDSPVLDLLFHGAQVHREAQNFREVQQCTLLSIKTGGCSEDCSYCPQSSRYDTGLKAQRLMSKDVVIEAAKKLECPVCKALVEEEKLVPLYGRGKNPTDPWSKPVPGVEIPHRPTGQRSPTAAQREPNQNPNLNLFHNVNWGGGYSFGFGTFGLFPMLSFQVNGFPGAGYGLSGGYNQFGYGNPNPVHGRPAYRYNAPQD